MRLCRWSAMHRSLDVALLESAVRGVCLALCQYWKHEGQKYVQKRGRCKQRCKHMLHASRKLLR